MGVEGSEAGCDRSDVDRRGDEIGPPVAKRGTTNEAGGGRGSCVTPVSGSSSSMDVCVTSREGSLGSSGVTAESRTKFAIMIWLAILISCTKTGSYFYIYFTVYTENLIHSELDCLWKVMNV